MKTLSLVKVLGVAVIFSGFAVSTAGADNTGHDTRIACYASVHTECYGGGQNNCSDEVYNEGLDECDAGFPNSNAGSQGPMKNLKAATKRVMKLMQ